MLKDAVVVGGGTGALRAAAVLSSRGRKVTLIFQHAMPDLASIPEDRGVWVQEPVGSTLGEARSVPWRRGVLAGGRQLGLPLGVPGLLRLIPAAQLPKAGAAWGRTRGAVELARLIGGGHEQRTYARWLGGRFGEPIYERLHAPYATRRFGSTDELSCNVARLVHGVARPHTAWAPAAGHPEMARALRAGLTVREGVGAVRLSPGVVECGSDSFEGELFVDLRPVDVVAALGVPASDALARDAALLGALHQLQVRVRVDNDGVARFEELHALDAPFFRVTRPAGLPGEDSGTLIAHYSCSESDPLWRATDSELLASTAKAMNDAGLSGAQADGVVVRHPYALPAWQSVHLSRYRRYLLEMELRGIVPVGRLGTHSLADAAEESAYLFAVTGEERPSLRACHREHLEPPVLDPEERVPLRRFVER